MSCAVAKASEDSAADVDGIRKQRKEGDLLVQILRCLYETAANIREAQVSTGVKSCL